AQFGCHVVDAGDIATRPAEACHDTGFHRIGAGGKDDGNGGSRFFRSKGSYCADRCDNHSYLTLHQISGQFLKPAILTVRPTEFDCDVPALRVAGLAKALSKSRKQAGVWFCRAGMQETDHRHLAGLLRSRREWPRRRAAEQRDERAPFHCSVSPVLPTERIAHLSLRQADGSLFESCLDREC